MDTWRRRYDVKTRSEVSSTAAVVSLASGTMIDTKRWLSERCARQLSAHVFSPRAMYVRTFLSFLRLSSCLLLFVDRRTIPAKSTTLFSPSRSNFPFSRFFSSSSPSHLFSSLYWIWPMTGNIVGRNCFLAETSSCRDTRRRSKQAKFNYLVLYMQGKESPNPRDLTQVKLLKKLFKKKRKRRAL